MAVHNFAALAPGLTAIMQHQGERALRALAVVPEPLEPSCLPIKLVRTGVGYVITYCTLASVLFILTCILLLRNSFHDSKRRKLPIFLILCLSMVLGLLGSILNTVFWATLLIRENPSQLIRAPSYWLASTTMLFVTPLVTHVALIFRIRSFYPPMLASRAKMWAVIAVPVALKVLRIPWIILYLHAGYKNISRRGYQTFDAGLADKWASTFPTVEFAITLVDSIYTCVFLLYKFRQLGDSSIHRHNELLERRTSWIADKFQQISAAAVFGFVVPTLWTVALLACVASPAISPTEVGYMLIANVFVQLFFTTLACLSRSGGWRDERYVTTMPDVYTDGWTEAEKEHSQRSGGSLAPLSASSRRGSSRSGQDLEVPPLSPAVDLSDEATGTSTGTHWGDDASCPSCRSRRAELAKRHAGLALDFGLLGPGTAESNTILRRQSQAWLPPLIDDQGPSPTSTGPHTRRGSSSAAANTSHPSNKLQRILNEYSHLGHGAPKRPPMPRHRSQPGALRNPPSPVATFGAIPAFRPATGDSDSTALNSEGWSPSRRGSAAKGSETSGTSSHGAEKDAVRVAAAAAATTTGGVVGSALVPILSQDPLGADAPSTIDSTSPAPSTEPQSSYNSIPPS